MIIPEEIKVKLYATLRSKSPKGLAIGEAFPVQISNEYTVKDLLHQLDISEEEAKIVMINGITSHELTTAIKPDDLVVIFPPVGGG